jgi:hypothetical protein
MCNRVAYEAISVLGGSGYMKDYPLERLYRDARITSIYEGTTQLQVLAAVRNVTSGTAEKRFAEFEAEAPPPGLEAVAEPIRRMRAGLEAAVAALKQGPADYLDLVSRPLVDVAVDIYLCYLWRRMGRHSEAKAAAARRFIGRAAARTDATLRVIAGGDRSTLDAFDALVGPTFPEQ